MTCCHHSAVGQEEFGLVGMKKLEDRDKVYKKLLFR